MGTQKQTVKLKSSALKMIDNGKYKIRVMRRLKSEVPDELIQNVLLKIS